MIIIPSRCCCCSNPIHWPRTRCRSFRWREDRGHSGREESECSRHLSRQRRSGAADCVAREFPSAPRSAVSRRRRRPRPCVRARARLPVRPRALAEPFHSRRDYQQARVGAIVTRCAAVRARRVHKDLREAPRQAPRQPSRWARMRRTRGVEGDQRGHVCSRAPRRARGRVRSRGVRARGTEHPLSQSKKTAQNKHATDLIERGDGSR